MTAASARGSAPSLSQAEPLVLDLDQAAKGARKCPLGVKSAIHPAALDPNTPRAAPDVHSFRGAMRQRLADGNLARWWSSACHAIVPSAFRLREVGCAHRRQFPAASNAQSRSQHGRPEDRARFAPPTRKHACARLQQPGREVRKMSEAIRPSDRKHSRRSQHWNLINVPTFEQAMAGTATPSGIAAGQRPASPPFT